MSTKIHATIEDLYGVPDNAKAEIVNGEVLLMSPTGDLPNRAAGAIYISLRQYEPKVKGGRAYSDNAGFKVNLPQRESFSPDAAFHTGKPTGMKFLEGAPIFAVEVRSAGDYGHKAEEEIPSRAVGHERNRAVRNALARPCSSSAETQRLVSPPHPPPLRSRPSRRRVGRCGCRRTRSSRSV
ncbi:MAG: hypothetical protein DMF67_14010 [Acidobacteria bacterium]|nr:MAG: hypothetical protein DMF67_14010 [Acidobacteriota bacterium]